METFMGSVGLTIVSPPVVGLTVSHMRAVECDSSASEDRWCHCNRLRGRWRSGVGPLLKVLSVISSIENQPSSPSFTFQSVFLKRRSWRCGVGQEITKEEKEEELDEKEKEKNRKAEEMGRRD